MAQQHHTDWQSFVEGRRHVLAILNFDIAGSSSIVEQMDSRHAKEYLDAYRDEVEEAVGRHEGLLGPWTGDGIVCLFEEVEQTLQAFRSIKRRFGDLNDEREDEVSFRAGIEVGEVSFTRDIGKMTGDAMNLAGHLQKQCPEGQALITKDTWQERLPREEKERFAPHSHILHAGRQVETYAGGLSKRPPTPRSESDEERYLHWVWDENKHLRVPGFEMDLRFPIELDRVYVTLRARPAHLDLAQRARGAEEPEQREMLEPLDIGGALKFCEERGFDACVILGDPGSGKTTLLKWLAVCLSAPERAGHRAAPESVQYCLPILLPLRAVEDKARRLDEICTERHAAQGLRLPRDFFESHLEAGKCLVMLDGLDEVADDADRKCVSEWVVRQRNLFRRNMFLITSRFAGYRGEVRLPPNFLELDIQDFNDDDIVLFLQRWYDQVETRVWGDTEYWRSMARQNAEDLIERVRSRKDLRELATNPLMLQVIALVHRLRGQSMPDRRVKLYEACTDLLLEQWDKARGIEVLLSAEEARVILQPLALWLHSEEGRRTASAAQVTEVVAPYLERLGKQIQDVAALLERLRDRSGLLVGFDVDAYGFQHLSFQEYLVAEEIRSTRRTEILVKHFGKSWWQEPTLLAASLTNPSLFADFARRLVKSDRFRQYAPVALECVQASLVKEAQPFVEALNDKRRHWETHYHCVRALREMGTAEAVQGLRLALGNREARVTDLAREALIALCQMKAERRRESFVNEKDGSEMLLVPAGDFIMGSDSGRDDERPQRTVYLDTYSIGKYPVTNDQYRKFVEATGHREPLVWGDKRYNHPDQPVVTVSWDDAVAYCKWAGLRLPTEAEWEKAARGTDARTYPWGSKWDAAKCNSREQGPGHTTPVGSYPAGASPYGCLDMAGNVWEWCADRYNQGYYAKAPNRNPQGPKSGDARVVRGGAFDSGGRGVRCAFRVRFSPHYRYDSLGFRVVVSPRP